MADLDTLRPEVREALEVCDRDLPQTWHSQTTQWGVIRAELLRLAGVEAQLGEVCSIWTRDKESAVRFLDRAEKAESELAALKARILPGAAKVEIADTDDPDGNPYGWVGGTLLSHNLIGKRVRLVVEE